MTNEKLKKYDQLVGKLLAVAHAMVSLAPVETYKSPRDPKVIAELLLVRTVSQLQGVCSLRAQSMPVEMGILVRCAYENLLYMERLVAEGDGFVNQMIAADVTSRHARGQDHFERGIVSKKAKAALAAQMKKWKKQHPNGIVINPKTIAKKGAVKDAYVIYGELSARVGHPSLQALDRYLQRRGNAVVINGDLTGDSLEVKDMLSFGCGALIGALIAFNQILESPQHFPPLRPLWNEFLALGKSASGKGS